jgi:hypothetical protein
MRKVLISLATTAAVLTAAPLFSGISAANAEGLQIAQIGVDVDIGNRGERREGFERREGVVIRGDRDRDRDRDDVVVRRRDRDRHIVTVGRSCRNVTVIERHNGVRVVKKIRRC